MEELFKIDTVPRQTWEDVFTPTQGEPQALGGASEGQILISPTIIGGILQGASYRSADSGARFEIFPEEDKTLGCVMYNAAGTSVFKTTVDGTNTGDVILGDYAGGAGAMWDQSASTFDVLGSVTAVSGVVGGWTITTGYLYSLASGTPTASPSDGLVLASGNEAMIVYENTQKRVEVGYLSAGVYGVKAYADDGTTTIFETSDTQKAIAGWHFTDTTLANHATPASANVLIDSTNSLIRLGPTAGTYISIDGANQKLESSDYSSGYAGAGFHLSAALLETGNAAIRGIIRTAVFQKDVISAVGGNVAILDADVLATTMTALDADTITIEGNTTFAVNDILRIKDGTDDEWFTVTNIGSAPTYTVTRDGGADYAADTNPTWSKGATVVNYGASGDGGIYMTASESNAPYLSVFTHAGSPWDTITTRLRIGNLNGYLGYTTDLYGIGIGDDDNYLKFDPTGSLKIKVSGGNALEIAYGSDILLTHGGDIKFTSVTAPTACTGALAGAGAGNVDDGTHKYKITYVNDAGETELGSVSNTVTVADKTSDGQVSLTSIPTSASSSVTSRKIYRTKAGGGSYYLLDTIGNNTDTTYTDNTADSGLTGAIATYRQNDSFGKIIIDDDVRGTLSSVNTFLGFQTAQSNTTGYYNTFVGAQAGDANTSGGFGSFLGFQAGSGNTTGDNNVFIGYLSGYKNTTGSTNTFLGAHAGRQQVDAIDNTFVGGYAGYNNNGDGNSFFGDGCGYDNTTGDYNTFLGHEAGPDNRTGINNVLVGRRAGYKTTTSNYNVAVGALSLYDLKATSKAITAFSDYSGTVAGTVKATSATHGRATGNSIVISGTDSYDGTETITVIDANEFYFTATWVANETTGWWQLSGEGEHNTALGNQAGANVVTGSDNIFLGYEAGYFETGSDKLFIDNARRASEADARLKALIYGVFDADPANQYLVINGSLGIGTVPAYELHLSSTGDTDIVMQRSDATNPTGSIYFLGTSAGDITYGARIKSYSGELLFYTDSTPTDTNNNLIQHFVIDNAGKMGMGIAAPLAKLHIDQASTTAAIPVLTLDQADVSDGFINFIGSDRGVIAGATASAVSVRVELAGTVYRLALYADA